jgi:hypothetical protein
MSLTSNLAAFAVFSLVVLVSFSGCIEDVQRIIDPYYDVDTIYSPIDNQTHFSINYGYEISNYDGNATVRLALPPGAMQSENATLKTLAEIVLLNGSSKAKFQVRPTLIIRERRIWKFSRIRTCPYSQRDRPTRLSRRPVFQRERLAHNALASAN